MSRYISLILTSIVFALNYLDQPLSTCNLLVRFNCAAITLIQAICTYGPCYTAFTLFAIAVLLTYSIGSLLCSSGGTYATSILCQLA